MSLVAASVALFVACGCGDKPARTGDSSAANEETIPYEVLKKENRRGKDKFDLDVLVSESASRQEVMKLAERLRREHDGRFATISIWDSREAWRQHPAMLKASLAGKTGKDMPYDEKEFDRHWLVVIDEFGQDIRWVAEGRDDPPAKGSAGVKQAGRPPGEAGPKAEPKHSGQDRSEAPSAPPSDKSGKGPPAHAGPKPGAPESPAYDRKAIYVRICAALDAAEAAAVKKYGRKPGPDDTAGFTVPYKVFVEREFEKALAVLAKGVGLPRSELIAIKRDGDTQGWARK